VDILAVLEVSLPLLEPKRNQQADVGEDRENESKEPPDHVGEDRQNTSEQPSSQPTEHPPQTIMTFKGTAPPPKLPKNLEAFIGVITDEYANRVSLVMTGSPAEEAGIRAKDLIVEIEGVPVDSDNIISEMVKHHGQQNVQFIVRRTSELGYGDLKKEDKKEDVRELRQYTGEEGSSDGDVDDDFSD